MSREPFDWPVVAAWLLLLVASWAIVGGLVVLAFAIAGAL